MSRTLWRGAAAVATAALSLCAASCARRPSHAAVETDPALPSARPHPASRALTPPGPVFTVAVDGDRLLCCAGSGAEGGQLADRIWSLESGGGEPRLLVQAPEGAQSMPARGEGSWLAWVEYGQEGGGALTWSLRVRREGGSAREVWSNRDDPALGFPNFEMEGSSLVFDLFDGSPEGGRDSPIMVHDLETGKSSVLARMEGYDLFDPYIGGGRVVFCALSLGEGGEPSSALCLTDIGGGGVLRLAATSSGYQPSVNARGVLFKEAASPYDYGPIRFHDPSTGRTRTLSAEGREGEQPVLGDHWAAWESPLFDSINGWDFRKGEAVVFALGNTGKPHMKGTSLAWVAEEEAGKPVVRFLALD